MDVYFEPESGTTFDQLDKITVTSDSINMNSEYSGEGIKVIDEDGNNVDVEVTVTDVSDDNAFEISFTPAITAGGEYTVKIPAGYFILGESQSHENDTLEYKCAVDYSFTTAPNNSDANFNAITVNANGKISINEDKLPEVVVKKSNGEQVTHAASYEAITDDNDKTTGYTLTLADNILVLGSYTYTIPAGLFNLGNSGKTNHELTGSAAVDGTQDDYSSLEVNLSDRESAPTELEQLSNEFSLTVSADDTYKTYDFSLVLSIDNITTGENIITADMTQSGNSDDGYTYSWTNSTAETLVAGNSYLFSVEVKTSGNDGESEVIGVFDLFTVAGTGSGWSDTKVKSISPDPENGEISLSDNVFTLTFDTDSALVVKVFADSSYVKVDENQYEFESIESDGEYSDVWTLTVSDTLMAKAAKNGGMDLVVVAKDKKGFAVGSDAETTTYSYTVAKPVISYDDSLTVDTISAITLSSDYLSLNANYEGDGILVLNGNDTVNVAVKAAKDGTTMTLSFSPAITLAGDYTIKIPEGYFLVGESQVYESDSLQLSRTIEYTFTTSPSGEISTFKEITVLSNGAIAVDTDSLPNIVVKTDAGGRVTNAASCDAIKTVNNNVLEYRFNLSDTITAGGSYTYSIPEGLLTLGGTDSKHEAISENVTVSGTSEDKAVYTITPASGATVKSMSEFTIVADRKIVMSSDDLNSTHVFYYSTNTDSNDDESTGDSQTTTRAAVLVEFASPIYDDDKTTIIGYTFTLEKEITDAGAYTISIPEGFFLVGDGDGNVTSRKLFATFNVEAATNE
ncbi:MAG: hypothetical protein LUC26_03030 [Prevotella sp.]|nr:hypothetical protein [Prevotella sp.]